MQSTPGCAFFPVSLIAATGAAVLWNYLNTQWEEAFLGYANWDSVSLLSGAVTLLYCPGKLISISTSKTVL